MPEHWEDQAPTEPEPSSFLRETPVLFWWVAAGLTVLTIIGIGAAWITQREADEPSRTDQEAVAGSRPDVIEVRLTDDGFNPADVDVRRNHELVVMNQTGRECALQADADQGHGVPQGEIDAAPAGGEARWVANEPGQYIFGCEGDDAILRVTVP